jgi:serine/threonine-protein kinase HipA
MRFTYSPSALEARPPGIALLSQSLPLRHARFTPSQTRPFFEGLLPEGEARRLISRQLGVRERAEFELLREIGRDCAGAVVILPIDETPSDDAPPVTWLSEAELARRIDDLPRNPLGLDLAGGVRMSLAGAQPKLVLVRDAMGRFGLPTALVPSTHILKPPQRTPGEQDLYEDVVTNELFCLRVFAEAGLSAARAERVDVEGRELLLVERFDRTVSDQGQISRVHQEDACQALGRVSTQKYEDDPGGVRLADLFDLVERVAPVPATQRLALLDRIVANFVLGNADAHAKNMAILYAPPGDGTGALAPAYDVVCTAAYPDLAPSLAMRIGGAREPSDVNVEAFARLAEQVGMGGRAAMRRVRDVSSRVVSCTRAMLAMSAASGWHRPVLDTIADIAVERARQLAGP